MRTHRKPGFVHVNAASEWPGFTRRGLELAEDGTVRLFRLPRLAVSLPAAIDRATVPSNPAAVTVTDDGSVVYIDGTRGALLRIDGCSGVVLPVSCIGEEAGDAPPIHARSIAAVPGGLVAAADPERSLIVFIEAMSGRVVEIWRGIAATALAVDMRGRLFASDGSSTVRLFHRRGGELWRTSDIGLASVAALAVSGERLYVLGEADGSGAWAIVSLDPFSEAAPTRHSLGGASRPMGLAVTNDAIYVGDNASRRLIKISRVDESLFGAAIGYRGPVAGIALDSRHGIHVHAGGPAPPLRLHGDAGCAASGVMWGPVRTGNGEPACWHRARASLTIPDGAHAQIYIATTSAPVDVARLPPFGPGWTPKGLDVADAFVGGPEAEDFWLGVHFFSDGANTPTLTQVRCTFNQPSYLSLLPPIYQEPAPCGDFLLRYLSLFESFFTEAESSIDALPMLFDPDAAPADALSWLASWLAAEDDERWGEATRREVIRAAFEWYGRRGTPEGIRQALRLFAGIDAVIDEPIQHAKWWGDGSPTVVAAEPQGAVVGVSAVLDGSHLLRLDEFGQPLFDDVAHRFTVLLHRHSVATPERLQKATDIIERERPAHTSYDIRIVEPAMRIGQQARIGIDSVVAGVGAPSRLGESAHGFELAGEPPPALGRGLRAGINTRA